VEDTIVLVIEYRIHTAIRRSNVRWKGVGWERVVQLGRFGGWGGLVVVAI
jgi:hypothetical protein